MEFLSAPCAVPKDVSQKQFKSFHRSFSRSEQSGDCFRLTFWHQSRRAINTRHPMPSLKSNVFEVSINDKVVARVGLKRSGNGSVIVGLLANRRKRASEDDPQYISSLCLEVDGKGTYRYFDFIDHLALEVGDVVSIRVMKGGPLSGRRLRRKETRRQRDLSKIRYLKTAKS